MTIDFQKLWDKAVVIKWCSHCRKTTHNDSECWSTRTVKGEPGAGPMPSGMNLTPDQAWAWGHQTGYRVCKGEGQQWAEHAANERAATLAQQASPADRLRALGLTVAVHNDYRVDGVPHTFWLFTDSTGMSYKGEGKTDAEALEQVFASLPASWARE
jgi:hypothetical protein